MCAYGLAIWWRKVYLAVREGHLILKVCAQGVQLRRELVRSIDNDRCVAAESKIWVGVKLLLLMLEVQQVALALTHNGIE
jgi:hypothetical protein